MRNCDRQYYLGTGLDLSSKFESVARALVRSRGVGPGGTAMSKVDICTPAAETLLEGQDFRLPAVDRAMSLFELLANSQQGLTLSELSRKLSIPKSTTHYL